MKTRKLKITSKRLGIGMLFIFSLVLFFVNCDGNAIPQDNVTISTPDANKESGIEYYYPDSGAVRTKLIIKGYNLGTDTSLLKVTVNGKNARIVGINNDILYAVVPARADTGLVKLFLTKNGQTQEFAFEKEFLYKFTRNVTTYTGKDIVKERVDGALADARTRRPWFLRRDKDNTLYILEEGRGRNRDGALRRIIDGQVETLYENNGGPFQSPTSMDFSPQQDTMYIAQTSASETNTTAAVAYCTREGGFVNMKTLVDFENAKTTAVAANPITGEVYFNSRGDGYIYKYTGKGTDPKAYERVFQVNSATDTELRMRFSEDGKTLYIVVRNRHCIFKSTYNEATRTLSTPVLWVGAWDESGYVNGTGGVARFNNPGGLSIDEDGNAFIPDKNAHIIRKITPKGEVSLYAGMPNQDGYKDGGPEFARFRQPECVEILDDGAIYVADRETYCIRRVMVE